MKAQPSEPMFSYFPAPAPRQRPVLTLWSVSYVLIGLLVGGVVGFKVFQPIRVLPRIQLAPTFTLTDQTGASLTSGSLRGQLALYTFAYTRCGAACEAQWQTLREIHTRLPEAQLGEVPFNFIIVSIDAEHDRPAVLSQFAASLGAEAKTWRFVSASDANRLKTLVGEGFGVYYSPHSSGAFDFDPVFVLVDGLGVIRGEYRYQTEAPNASRILRHLSMLAEEVRNSHGLTKYVYEAAHYFLCYAP